MAEGSLSELRSRAALPVAMLVTPAGGNDAALAIALPEAIRTDDGRLRLVCEQAQKLPLLSRIAAFDGQVSDVDVVPPSLEDIYSHFSRRAGQ